MAWLAALASQSNSLETCLRETSLRNLCLPHSLFLPCPSGNMPLAPQKGDQLWLLGEHTSFWERGSGYIVLSKVLNEKRNHTYPNVLIIGGRGPHLLTHNPELVEFCEMNVYSVPWFMHSGRINFNDVRQLHVVLSLLCKCPCQCSFMCLSPLCKLAIPRAVSV